MNELTRIETTLKDWETDQEVRWCPGCGDGMSKGPGYIEGDDDDCETNPCDVATGAMTL